MRRTTKAEREQAVNLHNQGLPVSKIADLYGVKPDTVRSWISPEFAAAQARKFAKRSVIRRRSTSTIK